MLFQLPLVILWTKKFDWKEKNLLFSVYRDPEVNTLFENAFYMLWSWKKSIQKFPSIVKLSLFKTVVSIYPNLCDKQLKQFEKEKWPKVGYFPLMAHLARRFSAWYIDRFSDYKCFILFNQIHTHGTFFVNHLFRRLTLFQASWHQVSIFFTIIKLPLWGSQKYVYQIRLPCKESFLIHEFQFRMIRLFKLDFKCL